MGSGIERVEFSDKYHVGILTIDRQHEHIFSVFGHFADALEGGEIGLCWPFVDELFDILRHHFEEEERILERLGFLGVGDHRLHHARFLEHARTRIMDSRRHVHEDVLECYRHLLHSFIDDVVDADLHIFHHVTDGVEDDTLAPLP